MNRGGRCGVEIDRSTYCCHFFFSSRRRHTRLQGDWSSDVCSSDLVADVTQMDGPDLKRIMRTGTVASTDNRNWELLPNNLPQLRFSQSRAVALDMESATIAANGFRFRVPYGTLLCVSDKPLHGEIKLPGMANHFYRERVDQHLQIGRAHV